MSVISGKAASLNEAITKREGDVGPIGHRWAELVREDTKLVILSDEEAVSYLSEVAMNKELSRNSGDALTRLYERDLRIKELEKQNSDLAAKLTLSQRETENLYQVNGELSHQRDTAIDAKTKAQATVGEVSAQNCALRNSVRGFELDLDNLKRARSADAGAIERHKANSIRADERVAELRTANANLLRQVEELETKLKEAVSDKRENHVGLIMQCDTDINDLHHEQEETARLHARIAELLCQVQDKKNVIQRLERMNASQRGQLRALTLHNQRLEATKISVADQLAKSLADFPMDTAPTTLASADLVKRIEAIEGDHAAIMRKIGDLSRYRY